VIKLFKWYYKAEDIIPFFLWITFLIICTRVLPETLKIIGYFVFLVSFLISKKNVLWFAVALVSMDFPGGFLNYGDMVISSTIRDYTFIEAFILFTFIKSLKCNKSHYPLLLRTGFIILAFYIAFLFIYSLGLGATSLKILRVFRYCITWSLLFSMPRLLNYKDFVKLFHLIFSFLPIALVIQFSGYFTGTYLSAYFFGTKTIFVDVDEKILRVVSGVFPAMLGLLGSLIYYERNTFPKSILNINIVLAFVFIISTATRGWTIGFIGALIAFNLFYWRKSIKLYLQLVFIMIFIYLVISFIFPVILKQLTFAYDRLITVELIAEGDNTAGGTLQRLDTYAPIMLKYFEKRPLLGYGFMDEYSKVSNGHLGYHNLLLSCGIIGFVLLFGFVFVFISHLFIRYKKNPVRYSSLKGIISIFVFLLLINSGSFTFGFINIPFRIFLLSLIFVLGSAFYFEGSEKLETN
jgi:hypothetical protein